MYCVYTHDSRTPTRSLCVSSASEEKVLSLTAEVEAAKRQTRMKKVYNIIINYFKHIVHAPV